MYEKIEINLFIIKVKKMLTEYSKTYYNENETFHL